MDNKFSLPDIISGLNSQKACFTFHGHLQQQPMQWHCTLQTLDNVYQEQANKTANPDISLQQFINIEKRNDNEADIHIGLPLKCIDKPAVIKTIIMIHNYKNLCEGLHTYGDIYYYPEER